MLEQWAFGFASAIAAGVQLQTGRDPLASLDAGTIQAWLAGYCSSRPGDTLSVALTRMVLAAASR
jgi:hypothetical protein